MAKKYNWVKENSNITISSNDCLFTLRVDYTAGICRERFATLTGSCGSEFPLENLGGADIDIGAYMLSAANSYLWRYNREEHDIEKTAYGLGVECLDEDDDWY